MQQYINILSYHDTLAMIPYIYICINISYHDNISMYCYQTVYLYIYITDTVVVHYGSKFYNLLFQKITFEQYITVL